jgi:hypothetical protein
MKDEEVMRIIYDNDIEGVKVVPIGRIHAASGWHGRRSAVTQDFYKAKALENLVDVAEDCDADAIMPTTGISPARPLCSGLASAVSPLN